MDDQRQRTQGDGGGGPDCWPNSKQVGRDTIVLVSWWTSIRRYLLSMCILKRNHFTMEELCKLTPACSSKSMQINGSKWRKLQRKRRRHQGQNGTTRIRRRQQQGGEDNIEEVQQQLLLMQWCATAVEQREAIATKLKGTKGSTAVKQSSRS